MWLDLGGAYGSAPGLFTCVVARRAFSLAVQPQKSLNDGETAHEIMRMVVALNCTECKNLTQRYLCY